MKKAEVFFDAITGIREDLIEEALDYRFQKRAAAWQRYLRNAACLALVVLVGFGAVRFGLFGGFGGSDGATNDMACDSTTTAPESAGQNDTAEAPQQPDTSIPGESGSDSGPGHGVSRFTGTVLEIRETWILVEPSPGESILASADRFMVSTADVENLPELKAGDEIAVIFDGFIRESYPAQITAVSIELLPQE